MAKSTDEEYMLLSTVVICMEGCLTFLAGRRVCAAHEEREDVASPPCSDEPLAVLSVSRQDVLQ